MIASITALFARRFGRPPASVVRVAADGSQRSYFRLSGSPLGTMVGVHGPDADENRAFLSFSRAFRGIGLSVPEIYAADERHGVWLEEDLGDTSLFQALSGARPEAPGTFPAAMLEVYERVVEALPRFQVEGGRVVDFAVAYPRPAFDRQSMMWDLNYFKYHFVKLANVPFNEQALENDFQRLTEHLLTAPARHFLYRDFQSRNIMLREGEPWFIDYQGGRRGAPHYDIASLLYDAKADIPVDVREHLLHRYIEALSRQIPVDPPRFIEMFRSFVLIRIMQAMGAYGYRGFFERRARFLESVPYAARNVATLLDRGLPIDLPEVKHVFERIVEAWSGRTPSAPTRGLTVRIVSFSYRQGPPRDDTGHGGGFIFDCRSLPNPGRHAEYANATGLDRPVAEFLGSAAETAAFWSHVVALVDAHIASYRARGFSDLAVGFGCTGGQHRSVYFAERLASHVRARHPDVTVRVEHGEQARWSEAEDTIESPGPGPAASLSADVEPWTR